MASRDDQPTLPDNCSRIKRAAETPTFRDESLSFTAFADALSARLAEERSPRGDLPDAAEDCAPRAFLAV
jgi:hypothetical protein